MLLSQLAAEGRFLLSWERLEFDETKQRLLIKAHPHLLPQQQVSSWSVMVMVHEIGWVSMDGVVHTMRLLRLNKVLIGSCNASCIWNGLMDGSDFVHARRSLQQIRDRSDDSFLIWEPDAASPNLKCAPHQVAELRQSSVQGDRKCLFDLLPCGLHQVSHVVQQVCAPDLILSLIRGLHALCLLLVQGNYFMRMVFVIPQVVRRSLQIKHSPPGALVVSGCVILSLSLSLSLSLCGVVSLFRSPCSVVSSFRSPCRGAEITAQRNIFLDMFFPAPMSRNGRPTDRQRQLIVVSVLLSCIGAVGDDVSVFRSPCVAPN